MRTVPTTFQTFGAGQQLPFYPSLNISRWQPLSVQGGQQQPVNDSLHFVQIDILRPRPSSVQPPTRMREHTSGRLILDPMGISTGCTVVEYNMPTRPSWLARRADGGRRACVLHLAVLPDSECWSLVTSLQKAPCLNEGSPFVPSCSSRAYYHYGLLSYPPQVSAFFCGRRSRLSGNSQDSISGTQNLGRHMPESFSANNTFVFIADDADLSSISYSGTWAHTVDNFIDAYDDTGSEGLPGASATMLFSGYNVAAYAALPDSVQDLLTADPSALLPPNVTVVLDDAPPTRVSVPLALDAPFFAATGLAPDRPHTLAITIDAANARAAFPFVLDAVAYATTIPPAALATAVPPHRQKALAPSASGRGGAFYTAVVSQAAASAAGTAPVPVGAIVAGVLGGVTLLVCAALAVYLLYARRRRWRRDMAPDPYFMDDPLLVGSPEDKQPLIGRGPPLPSSPQPFAERETDDPFAYPPRASTSRQPSDPASFSAGALTSTPNARPSRRKAEEAGVLSVPRSATYHSDSGIRFTNAGQPISAAEDEHDVDSLDGHESVPPGEDFPPSYSVR